VLGAVLGWLDTTDPRLILVLADFGHGKTFLTREIARQVPTLLPRVVPMVISLRMFEKSHTLDTVLAMHLQEAGEDGVPVRAVRRMLERGQLLLIFDGFDELAVRLTYDGAAEHLRMILSAVSGRAKVILTSRTQHFASNRQLLNALGEQVHLQPAARLVRLERFDDEQIQEFLRRSYARSTDPALAAAPQRAARDRFSLLNRISDLRGLAQTPRMLAFIADLPERDLLAARSADGRITQTDLYRTLVDRWLRFEAARKRPTAGALPSLDADQLRKAATAIALRRWTTDETGLDLPTLQTVVDEALPDIGKIELDAAQTLFAIGSGSLLTRDDNDRFGFVHSSVMEYLVAAAMTKELAETGDSLLLDSRQTSALIIDFLVGTRTAHADLERWARGRLKAVDGRRPTGLWRRRRAPVGSGPGRLNALALASRLGLAGLAPDLSMQDLRGVDLTSRDLRYANLMGADLRGVQLADLDLTGADLRGADLTGTRLTRPKLRGARLENSDWHRAALLAPDLDPADLDADALSPAAIPGRDAAQPMWLPYLLGEPTLAWDGRGELLAAAWGNHVLLTTAELVPLRVLRGQGDVTALALASDGRTLAIGGSDGAVLLADLDAGPRVRQLTGHPATVRALAFAPDGQIMASADRTGYIWHWAVTSGRGVRRSEAGFDVVSMAFACDGQTLAAGGNGVIAQHLENPMLHLDDLTQSTSATRILPPTSSANQLNCLALATAGDTVAVGCRDGTILLLSDFAVHGDATSVHDPGTQVLRSHTSAVLAVAFDGDELISVDVGNLCRSKGTKVCLVHTSPYSYIPSVGIVATLAPSGGLVCRAGRDGAAEVWDPPAGQITGLVGGEALPVLGRRDRRPRPRGPPPRPEHPDPTVSSQPGRSAASSRRRPRWWTP